MLPSSKGLMPPGGSRRAWLGEEYVQKGPDALRIGYTGSYVRVEWGVESDLDLVVTGEHCGQPSRRRTLEWDVTSLRVPTDVLACAPAE